MVRLVEDSQCMHASDEIVAVFGGRIGGVGNIGFHCRAPAQPNTEQLQMGQGGCRSVQKSVRAVNLRSSAWRQITFVPDDGMRRKKRRRKRANRVPTAKKRDKTRSIRAIKARTGHVGHTYKPVPCEAHRPSPVRPTVPLLTINVVKFVHLRSTANPKIEE